MSFFEFSRFSYPPPKSPFARQGDLSAVFLPTPQTPSAREGALLEQEIDKLVYSLYNLNESEIELIEKGI
ncbi:hypothetical protein DMC01_09930 [Campylobacter troglodytis]|nr:hypothetical protein DMC01_09930 [Campylobacter troglodytis]